MISVEITASIRKRAEEYNVAVLEAVKNIKNYTGSFNVDRYLVGYIGELCFISLLRQNNVQFLYPAPVGTSDGGDFFCSLKGKLVSLDVKTASKGNHKFLMIPDVMLQRHKRDAYIGARLNGAFCEFFGYLPGKQVKDLQVSDSFHPDGVVTRYQELTKLKPLENLFQQLEKISF